jgi:WhiB family redox-sensing transcriptional regulator
MVQINPSRYVTPRTPDVFEFRRPAWQRHAQCRGRMKEFFAEYMSAAKTAELKSVCAQCTVRAECLALAMSFEIDRDGIYGGLLPRERALLRVRRTSDQEKSA